jgi:hypothetical protein
MTRSNWLPLFLLWLLAVLACGLAAAAPRDAGSAARRHTYVLSQQDCRNLTEATPAPDLAYRPGIDARGGPVIPADLPDSTQLVLPDALPVGIDLYIGNPADLTTIPPAGTAAGNADARGQFRDGRYRPPSAQPPGFLYAPEVDVGEIAMVRTPIGYDLYFNGRPLEDPIQRYIRHACADWAGGIRP